MLVISENSCESLLFSQPNACRHFHSTCTAGFVCDILLNAIGLASHTALTLVVSL